MTRKIRITLGMKHYIDGLNAIRPHHDKNNNSGASSLMAGFLVTIRCPSNVCVGKNAGDVMTVGTIAEVHAGTHEITSDVANDFIIHNFAEEV